jgi:hypothetical protein
MIGSLPWSSFLETGIPERGPGLLTCVIMVRLPDAVLLVTCSGTIVRQRPALIEPVRCIAERSEP